MAGEETAPKKANKGLIGAIIAAVVVVIIAIVAVCLNSSSKIVGKYNLTAFIQDGKEETSMVELLKAFGGSYTIEFKKDKTGVIEMKAQDSSESIEFKWEGKKIKMEEDGETIETDFEYKNDTVTVTIEGQGMKFEREK